MTWNKQASLVDTAFRRIIRSYTFCSEQVSRMITYCKVIRGLVKTVVMSDFLFGFVKTGERSGPYAT